ncbi:cytochrome b [bacterium]|nr:cytochrome b [bacterium]
MTLRSGYSGLQIGLHWAAAVLIAANYVISDGMGEALDARLSGQPVLGLTPVWHVWAGTALLAVVAVRLIVRLMSGNRETTGPKTLAERAADVGHWVLYGLMLAVPALGAITWFGMTDSTGDLHVLVMNAMMLVILGHAAMAIFHHFVLKDGLLRRMIPLN